MPPEPMKRRPACVEPGRGEERPSPHSRQGVAMRSESNGANGQARAARTAGPKPRFTRSLIAKPLLTSLGALTMVAAASFVVLGVSSTGSVRPWDWTHADPAAALGRYQVCGQQGLGALGCMLTASVRPASAAGSASGVPRSERPLVSVATVQDPPSQQPAAGQAKPAHSSQTGGRPAASQHLVALPPGADTDDVLAA